MTTWIQAIALFCSHRFYALTYVVWCKTSYILTCHPITTKIGYYFFNSARIVHNVCLHHTIIACTKVVHVLRGGLVSLNLDGSSFHHLL